MVEEIAAEASRAVLLAALDRAEAEALARLRLEPSSVPVLRGDAEQIVLKLVGRVREALNGTGA